MHGRAAELYPEQTLTNGCSQTISNSGWFSQHPPAQLSPILHIPSMTCTASNLQHLGIDNSNLTFDVHLCMLDGRARSPSLLGRVMHFEVQRALRIRTKRGVTCGRSKDQKGRRARGQSVIPAMSVMRNGLFAHCICA